jgi:hypothetical protein
MNAVEDMPNDRLNARTELDTLSEWVKSTRGILKSRIIKLERLHEEYILVLADKASDSIAFLCKTRYYNCILNELGISFAFGNPTYTPTAHSKDENL